MSVEMLEPDWDQDVPSRSEVSLFWKAADFPLHPVRYEAVNAFCSALKDRYRNGAVVFGSFLCPRHVVSDWFQSRNRLEQYYFFSRFWRAPSPSAALFGLRVKRNYANDPAFQWSTSFALAGELAHCLFLGGAYHHTSGTGQAEMSLSKAAALDLFGERYADVQVYTNHAAWAGFFHGVAWDYTWVAIDKRQRLIHVLCATDTD